jgi:hypothetical protein
MSVVKTFKYDRVVRDSSGMIMGRAVCDERHPYAEGEPLHLVLLTVPSSLVPNPLSFEFFVDGIPYRVPESLPDIRISREGGVCRINTVIMHPVSHGS